MAVLKTSKIIPVMVVAFVAMGGFVFFKASQSGAAQPVVTDAGQWMRSAPKPRTADSDTSNDTIRAIHGEASLANANANETLAINKRLIEELDSVITEKDELKGEMELEMEEELLAQSEKQAKQFEQMMAQMSAMVDQIGSKEVSRTVTVIDNSGGNELVPMEIPDGFWIEPLDESLNNRVGGGRPLTPSPATLTAKSNNKVQTKADEARAVLMKPLDTYRDLIDNVADEPGILGKGAQLINPGRAEKMSTKGWKVVEIGASYRGAIKRQTGNNNQQQLSGLRNGRAVRPSVEPVFTIPDLSILSGAVATTSLVGKIYPDGNVVDPQFFKLIVGRENFTANYQELPSEIEGMIFEGFGIGEFSTRCVSGRIIAATFIFEDGTTRSVYPGDAGSRPNQATNQSMGYITDPYGNPCVAGRLITDAAEFIATGGALAFGSAFAGAVQEAARTTTETFGETGASGNRTTNVTGDTAEFAAAAGANAAFNRGLAIVDELFSRSQALIYSPSGARVDIHLQQELRLDIASNARKIRYRRRASRETELD